MRADLRAKWLVGVRGGTGASRAIDVREDEKPEGSSGKAAGLRGRSTRRLTHQRAGGRVEDYSNSNAPQRLTFGDGMCRR
jgi:hypothetical protein